MMNLSTLANLQDAYSYLKQARDLVDTRQKLIFDLVDTRRAITERAYASRIPEQIEFAKHKRYGLPRFQVFKGGQNMERLDDAMSKLMPPVLEPTRGELTRLIRTLESLAKEDALFEDEDTPEMPRIVSDHIKRAIELLEEVRDRTPPARKKPRLERVALKV